jgi:hypothetical protein
MASRNHKNHGGVKWLIAQQAIGVAASVFLFFYFYNYHSYDSYIQHFYSLFLFSIAVIRFSADAFEKKSHLFSSIFGNGRPE